MGYTYRVFNLAAEIERSAWEEVCSSAEASIFLDLRFVMAVEAAMTPSCRFWYVLIYQEDGRPVACAGMTAMNVDLTDFGDPRATWILKQDFPILSRLRRMNILFCSLPGSPGDKSIAISPAAESRERATQETLCATPEQGTGHARRRAGGAAKYSKTTEKEHKP